MQACLQYIPPSFDSIQVRAALRMLLDSSVACLVLRFHVIELLGLTTVEKSPEALHQEGFLALRELREKLVSSLRKVSLHHAVVLFAGRPHCPCRSRSPGARNTPCGRCRTRPRSLLVCPDSLRTLTHQRSDPPMHQNHTYVANIVGLRPHAPCRDLTLVSWRERNAAPST